MPDYHGPDRRLYPAVPPSAPKKMPDHVTLEDIWELLHEHIQEEAVFRANVAKAFPKNRHGDVDWDGHGAYHEKLIDRAVKISEARERWAEKALGGSIWAIMLVLGGFMLQGALEWLKTHLTK